MPVRIHEVSTRNGRQVMVAGLGLRSELGYGRGAKVEVTNPARPTDPAWRYVVANDEHATLTNRTPPPPSWIQAGVRIRISVTPPSGPASRAGSPGSASQQPRSAVAQPQPGKGPRQLSRASTASTLFDSYVMIDWGSKSGRYPVGDRENAPWLAEGLWDSQSRLDVLPEQWFPTRRELINYLLARLVKHAKSSRRVLVGFDFPYGYPAGYGSALQLKGPSYWRAIWDELRRPTPLPQSGPAAPRNDYATPNNSNNRFAVAAHLNRRVNSQVAGPLYGCPSRNATSHFPQASPTFPFSVNAGLALPEFRTVERRLRGNGFTPLSCWWVLGGGAPTVGGQILTGVPSVLEIRDHPWLGAASHVWPFETGFTPKPIAAQGPAILHAEIWPGVLGDRLGKVLALDPRLVRDQAQVREMVLWCAERDSGGVLGDHFGPPTGLSDSELALCERQEGWILGAE